MLHAVKKSNNESCTLGLLAEEVNTPYGVPVSKLFARLVLFIKNAGRGYYKKGALIRGLWMNKCYIDSQGRKTVEMASWVTFDENLLSLGVFGYGEPCARNLRHPSDLMARSNFVFVPEGKHMPSRCAYNSRGMKLPLKCGAARMVGAEVTANEGTAARAARRTRVPYDIRAMPDALEAGERERNRKLLALALQKRMKKKKMAEKLANLRLVQMSQDDDDDDETLVHTRATEHEIDLNQVFSSPATSRNIDPELGCDEELDEE